MKKIKIAIIGAGTRGSLVPFCSKKLIDNIDISYVYDSEQQKARKLIEEKKLSSKVAASYDEILNDNEVEWVGIFTPNWLHADQACAAMRAGKDVFLEKPVATKIKDCFMLRDVQEQTGRKLLVGFVLRYAPHYQKIKDTINSGKIGDIISFEFNETLNFNHGGHIMSCWRSKRQFTGCHVLEKCSHDIDLMNWLVNSRVAKVASFGGLDFFMPKNSHKVTALPKDKNGNQAYCSWDTARDKNPFLTDKDIIDNQVAIIEYENGVRGTFHTNLNAALNERRMYILGTDGAIRADLVSNVIEVKTIGFDEKVDTYKFTEDGNGHGGGDSIMSDSWADVMLKNAQPLTPLETGIEAAVTSLVIDQAMQTNQIMKVDFAQIYSG